MNENTLKTPDITPMQMIVGGVTTLITAVVGLVNAFGWSDIDATESAALMGVWLAFGGVLVIADAVIRNGRSRALAANPPAQAENQIAG